MKMNKIGLLSLMFAMPFTGQASSNGRNTFSVSSSSANEGDLVAKAVGMAMLAPISGLMLGCHRRTLHQMEEAVVNQLNADQLKSFNNIFVSQIMDTKPYTTATGPLSVVALAGVASFNPIGFVVAGLATLGNIGCLLVAEKSQQYNDSRYQKALAAINLEKGLNKEEQVTGDKSLSDLQKLFCLSSKH